MSAGAGSGRWTAALDRFEERLDALDAALAAGDPEALPGPWRAPAPLPATATREQLERARALVTRAGVCERRLAEHLGAVAGELQGLDARAQAATSYGSNA